MRARLPWGIVWRAGLVAAGAFAFACQTGSEGYEVPGPVHVATVYVDTPYGDNGGTPGDQTPFASVAWSCQCLATDYAPDGALMKAPAQVMDALATPEIRVVLTKIVDVCVDNDPSKGCFEVIKQTDAGAYGYLDLKDHKVVSLATKSGMTDVPLAGFYNPEGSPVTLPPGPSIVVSPVSPLASGTTYTLSVNTNKSLVGKTDGQPFMQPAGPTFPKASPVFTMDFGTQALQVTDQMPQDILGPDGGVTMTQPIATPVQLGFTAPIDTTTIPCSTCMPAGTGMGITIAPAAGGANVPIDCTVDATGATVTCMATAGMFAPSTRFAVTAKAGVIKDTGGGTLAMDYVGYFTTGTM